MQKNKETEQDKEVLIVLKKIDILINSLEKILSNSRKDWKNLDKMIVINNGNQVYGDVSSFSKEKIKKYTLELVTKNEEHKKINKLLLLEDKFIFNKNTYEYWLSLFQKRANEINFYEKIYDLNLLNERLLLANEYSEVGLLEEAHKLLMCDKIKGF